jgi:hypothetical protein
MRPSAVGFPQKIRFGEEHNWIFSRNADYDKQITSNRR